MKYIILFLISIGCSISLIAQVIPLNEEYLVSTTLINPATSGLNGESNAFFTIRNQWAGYAGAPNFQSFGVDVRVKAIGRYNHSGKVIRKSRIPRTGRVGLSLNATNDVNDPFRRTGAQFAYAYHYPVRGGSLGILSFGSSVLLYQQNIERSFIDDQLASDPALANYENLFLPNLGLGLHYRFKRFAFSFSSLNIVPVPMYKSQEGNTEKVINQLFLLSTIDLVKNDFFRYSTGILFRSEPNSLAFIQSLDIGRFLNFSAVWRSTSAITGLLGLRLISYQIGYSFEIHYGEILSYNEGSHMFFIRYYFNQNI